MKRMMVFLYGTGAYAMFLGVFLYAIGFIGNFGTPTRIDGATTAPLGVALAINGALLGLFAVQHSGMARPAFKRWIKQYIPEAAERSTYVLMTNIAFVALFLLWQPMGGTIWEVTDTADRVILYTLYGAGWLVVLVTTFLINHFDLFGARQVWLYLLGKEYTSVGFVTPGPYKYIRHPLYVGWMMVFWFTPTMTVAHLFFAAVTTLYILVAIVLEERDLMAHFGQTYADYRRKVPMFLPRFAKVDALEGGIESVSESEAAEWPKRDRHL